MPAEKRNDGWWVSFGLRWGLLFALSAIYNQLIATNWGLRQADLFSRDSVIAHILWWPDKLREPYWRMGGTTGRWLAEILFGNPRPDIPFWGLVVDLQRLVPAALLWTIFDRRNRVNEVLRKFVPLLVRYHLSIVMFLYGTSKVIGHQGIPQPAPLEWIRPLGGISTGMLMWTWLGYSPVFHLFAGLSETIGATLLLFRRTTLLGALLILPVMLYVTLLDSTFHTGPAAAALLYAGEAFYLVARDWRRFAGVFLFAKPTAPLPQKEIWTSPPLVLVGRGLWVVMVAYGLWSYARPNITANTDIAGVQSPLSGAWRVERFVSNGRVLPEDEADPTRWREFAMNTLGDFVRITRMDNAQLLWSLEPGDPYRFLVVSGHDYRFGDYRKILAKTAAAEGQLKFKALPNYGSPQGNPKAPPGSPNAIPNYSNGQFFAVSYVRKDPDHLSLQGTIDGVEISADLRRIDNDSIRFFRSTKGLP